MDQANNQTHAPVSRWPRSRLALSAAGGAVAATLALLLALLVLAIAGGSDWQMLVPAAALGTFATSTLGFWLLLGLGRRLRVGMGIVTGILLGIVAHPATWYLMLVFANLTGVRSSLGEAPVDLLNGLWASWVYAAASLLVVGWVSIPLSAIVGGGFAHVARQHMNG